MEYLLYTLGVTTAGALIYCVWLRANLNNASAGLEVFKLNFEARCDEAVKLYNEKQRLEAKVRALQVYAPKKDKDGHYRAPLTGRFVKKPKLLDPIVQEHYAAYDNATRGA